jgi:DNA-binding MarR family transcriptional regulator
VLSDLLCFELYAASRALTAAYRPLLDPLGLTYPQYLVMIVLWESEPLPVGTLAERLRLDYGTVSPLLKRLEAAGLVRRERRGDDERSVQVSLTDAGRALREPASSVPAAICAAMGLDLQQLGRLRGQLRQLSASVAAHQPAGLR